MAEVKPEETQASNRRRPPSRWKPRARSSPRHREAAEPLAAPPTEVAKTEEPAEAGARSRQAQGRARGEAPEDPRGEVREQKREEARQERLEEIREAKAKAAREAKARQAKAQQGAEPRNSASASRQNAAGRPPPATIRARLRQWTGAISSAIHGRMNAGPPAARAAGPRWCGSRSCAPVRSRGPGSPVPAALVRSTARHSRRSAVTSAAGTARRDAVEPLGHDPLNFRVR